MNRGPENLSSEDSAQIELTREYWNKHPFEYQLSRFPLGTIDYFLDVESYYYRKYSYLKKYIDYNALRGKKGLDIGCGFGNTSVQLAKEGALVTGVDISELAVEMSKKNLELRNMSAEVFRGDGENLEFEDNSFDYIFAIATISYTPNPKKMIQEIHRTLKPGSEAYLTVYNVNSWLNILFKILNRKPPREDAPSFSQYTVEEFKQLLELFSKVEISTDRFPSKTQRGTDIQTILFDHLFIPAFGLIPKKLLKPYGHHIIAKVIK